MKSIKHKNLEKNSFLPFIKSPTPSTSFLNSSTPSTPTGVPPQENVLTQSNDSNVENTDNEKSMKKINSSHKEKILKSLTLMEKLNLASLEAKAERRLLEIEKQKKVLHGQEEYSLVSTDVILKRGMETLRKIKSSQTSMYSARTSQASLSGLDAYIDSNGNNSIRTFENIITPKKRSSALLTSFDRFDLDTPARNSTISLGNSVGRSSVSPLERYEN